MTLHAGFAEGELLRLSAPLSFWGGVDATGRIVDGGHPQRGAELAGRVVAMTASKGSSSSTSVLAEQLRAGVAPAAVLLAHRDPIIVLAAIVARELYDVAMPVVVLGDAEWERLPDSGHAIVDAADAECSLLVCCGSEMLPCAPPTSHDRRCDET